MSGRRSSRLVVGTLIAGLAAAACGGTTESTSPAQSASASPIPATAPAATPTPTPSPAATPTSAPTEPSAGGGRLEIEGEQFAITIPEDWNQVILTEEDIDAILDGFEDGAFTDDQVAMMKAAAGSGIKLMAFDDDGSGTNLNVLVQPTPIPISMLEPTLQAQLELIPGTSGIEIDTVEVDGEDVLLVTYDLDQTMADGTGVNMTGNQLYASANGRLYVVTLTVVDGSSVDARAILDTIEFLD